MKSLHNRRIISLDKAILIISFSFSFILSIRCSKDDLSPVIEYGTVSDIDSNSYKTVKIGDQIWMAENLKTTRLNNGNTISYIDTISSISDWQALTSSAFSVYNFNKPDSINIVYGSLYNWYAVNSNKLCPEGWHVPSEEEWGTLKTFVGGLSEYLGIKNIAAGKLKEADTLHWNYPNSVSNNATGFTALPGGWLKWDGTFSDLGKMGLWWTSTQSDPDRAKYFEISGDYSPLNFRSAPKYSGLSVRCIKD